MPRGDRLAILTNGGGMGVLATDALIEAGGQLAELSPETVTKLDRVLPPTWSHGNPVDIIGDAGGDRYAGSLSALLEDRDIDGVLVLNCPTAVVSEVETARAVIDVHRGQPTASVFTSWVGAETAQVARRMFAEGGVPTFSMPGEAVRAFMELVKYQRVQKLLMETPPSIPEDFDVDSDKARSLVNTALREGREWLTEWEAKDLLAAYGIPVVPTHVAATPKDAAKLAVDIGGPVALKILSPDILHKTDVGGVALDLRGEEAVRAEAEAMLARVREVHPDAHIEGVTVQPMVHRPEAFELVIGATEDPQFGPVILFGHGGTAVEVVDDAALTLPPLNMRLAHEVITQTRISRLLRGYRGRPAADLEGVALVLIQVAQLVIDFPQVVELDINPLLAEAGGVIALDARVRVVATDREPTARLAIRPYPRELEETIQLGDGRSLWLRPIRPEDEPSLQRHFATLSPEEIRMRFGVPLKTMTHVMAARFTQLDYDREMALVLTEPGIAGQTEIYGVVRIFADPDNENAEYAILVRHDMTGMGLGVVLMRRIIDYAKRRGIGEIWGDVLVENATMRKLCKVLGFSERMDPDEREIVKVTLRL
jgi:acetyltransferase